MVVSPGNLQPPFYPQSTQERNIFMKKYCHLLGIVLCVASLVLAMSSCNESMTNQIDRVVDTGPKPPVETPEIPEMESDVPIPEPDVSISEPDVPMPESDVQTPAPVAPLPEGTVVFIEPRQLTTPTIGQQLQVSINVKDAADVLAYEVTVGFDPTALRYVSITNADYLPAGAFAAPPQVSANSVYLAATSVAGSAAAADGTLAILTFEVVAAKASTITLSDVLLSDSNVTPLALTSVDGAVTAP